MDVNKNPGSWTVERKRGGLRTEETLRGGHVPADDIEAADFLIKAYQGALVDRVLELENQDQGNEKKELKILRPPKKNNQIPFKYEEGEVQESLTTQAPALPTIEESYMDPEEAAALEILTAPEEARPQEEEVQEVQPEEIQPEEPQKEEDPDIDYLSNEWEDIDTDPELTKKSLLADPGEVQEERSPKGPGLQIQEAVTAATLAPIIPSIKTQIDKYYEIESEKEPDFKPLNTPEMLNYLNKSAGALEVQDYDKKIETRFKEIFEALNSEINIAKAEAPENNTRADNLSKIYEKLEVLQLLQELRRRQAIQRQGQGPGPQEEALKNELRITRNPGGHSWKIILRGESPEELLEAGLKANERLIKELK